MFVFVLVGQCGLQLGAEFWRTVSGNKSVPGLCFSTSRHSLPCVLVDSEAKVLASDGLKVVRGQIHPNCVVSSKRGCGNNWACGYHMQDLAHTTVDRVRQTAERCDNFMGVVIIHSLSGGTGSGVTSHLMEELKQHFPSRYIVNVGVAPFTRGESPLQHYNSLLILSWIHHYSDCALVIHNTDLLQPHCTIEDINRAIALSLDHCLKPLGPRCVYTAPCELVRSLCPMDCCKFIKTTPTFNNWTIPSGIAKKEKVQSIVCIMRGDNRTIEHDTPSLDRQLRRIYTPPTWNPHPIDYWFGQSGGVAKRMSVLVNGHDVTNYLNNTRGRAMRMFDSKAYLHWYKKYGLEEDTFIECFRTIQTINDSYNDMCL